MSKDASVYFLVVAAYIYDILDHSCLLHFSLQGHSKTTKHSALISTKQMVDVLKLWPSRIGTCNRLQVAVELDSYPEF